MKKQLIEVALTDTRWADDARWAIHNDWNLVDIANEEAARLIEGVAQGSLAIGDLRAGVVWANALDREAVELYEADLMAGEQRAERVARRLMHMAGRMALNAVKSRERRLIAQVTCNRGQSLVQ